MAAMASPQPDGVIAEPKDVVKMVSAGDEQPPTSNGINGHPSPVATPPESKDPIAVQKSTSIDDATVEDPSSTNHVANHDAFATNQVISKSSPSPAADIAAPVAVEPVASEQIAAKPVTTEPVATTPPAEEEKVPSEIPEQPAAPSAGVSGEESAKAEDFLLPSTTEAAATSPEAEAKPTDPLPDVEMPDAPTQTASSEADLPVESTQITQVSDVSATSPAEDLNLHPASMSSLAIDASQNDPPAPETADTSMADIPSQHSVKVARERDEDNDDMDEPLAKRTKTEVTTALTEEMEAPAQEGPTDEMVVDQAPVVLPPRDRKQGEPGTLGDPTQESQPISQWANREIRKVLASVKKTKAGGYFKDPVSAKWPDLWEAYRAKIDHPVDINKMEKTLREGGYATLGEFVNEVYLIRENATVFNGANHTVTQFAVQLVENIFTRMAEAQALEPAKPDRKEPKQIATRHAEPRAAATQARRESRGAAASPTDEVVAESPVYAVPASGVPIIRRESTKGDGDRPKRPIHPPKSKDLGYEPKNLKKKKMSPEFRFCEEVLRELMKQKHWNINQWFLAPVDPVKDSAPTYHKVIKKPMDLGTMQEKLSIGDYNSTKDFENDFQLIIKNCRKFNGEQMPSPAATQLEELFKQKWAEKDEWMEAHAPAPADPVPAASPTAAAKEESEEEAEASEPEPEEETAVNSETLTALTARWTEEQSRLTQLIMAPVPDQTQIATQNAVIAMFMKQILDEKTRLAAAAPKKTKKPAKPKASKPKKPAAGAAAGAGKKAAPAAAKKAGAAAKKAAKRVMGQEEKNAVAEGINNLEGTLLEKAIDIIKKDTHQEESDTGELELDIDQLSQTALSQLYDLVTKANPAAARKAAKAAPAPEPAEAPPRPPPKSSKPKKHKPMGKAEQERSIEKLREIKAQFQRPGSGSQEPLPSVEAAAPPAAREDSDESDADSEED